MDTYDWSSQFCWTTHANFSTEILSRNESCYQQVPFDALSKISPCYDQQLISIVACLANQIVDGVVPTKPLNQLSQEMYEEYRCPQSPCSSSQINDLSDFKYEDVSSTQVSSRANECCQKNNFSSVSSLNCCSSKRSTKNLKRSRKEEDNKTLEGFLFHYRYLEDSIRQKRMIVCDYDGCSKEFSKSWNFLDHARMHLGLRPYECGIWGLAFTQKGNMVKHEQQHSSNKPMPFKPYKCSMCPRAYTEKYNLKVSYNLRSERIYSLWMYMPN